ncbi:pentatricopeptide repeat-containing protein At5g15300-like [Rhodamnia argentea]|uniref:Pentatricopeptide repeat-containing protein At5g15300-like n=1 Tax=Rhodamnia argentea TaxID=178133 RepID=A0A8B8N1B9_9MYRT|nr:pentatricopeptide repeat-containing protein At5g15300-like [Rhodamnia argentea]
MQVPMIQVRLQCGAQAPLSLAAALASLAETCLSMQGLTQIHARALRSHLQDHPMVLAKIFRFAAVTPSGDLRYAHRLFDQIPRPNGFFHNLLIRGYSSSSQPCVSVDLFNQMRRNGVDPDGHSFTFLLKARSRMEGRSDDVHGLVVRLGFSGYLFVKNALIHMYAMGGMPAGARRVFDETRAADVVSWSGLVTAHVRAGELELAREVFDAMPERDVVSWTALISGYTQASRSREALELFWDMGEAGVWPDEVTMVSVISACSNLKDGETGLKIHRYIEENGFGWMVSLGNALIHMHAQCGCMEQAWQVFNGMGRRSSITWNCMILACANHGDAEDAIDLFQRMVQSNMRPDKATFLALLVAYAHKGLVDEGYRLFRCMRREFSIEAGIEHYGCMVDTLGRAGRLEEAYNLIIRMPMPSNDVIWGSLLAACRIYHDVEMGERVVRKLFELNPRKGGYYVLLRDIYIAAGRTDEANEMEQTMAADGALKTPGYSWLGG